MCATRCVAAGCGLLVLGVLTPATAAAASLDKRTMVTVSAPFAVPGVTLPAGSYVFRLADDTRGRDVVQVLSADGGTAYAMFAAIRTSRGDPGDRAAVLFKETASDLPVAVRSWWYPADSQGYEFVYPRAQTPRRPRADPRR